jgi:hypothetical protein
MTQRSIMKFTARAGTTAGLLVCVASGFTGSASAEAPAPAAEPDKVEQLPAEHQPKLSLQVEPPNGVKLGGLVRVVIAATVPAGDDVTVSNQSFAPFEVYKKQARTEPVSAGGAGTASTQRFLFELELLALEPGDVTLPALELRVVTKDNQIGSVRTDARPYKVQSLLANEPNAQPKLESKPVAVLEDNWLPIYILAALAAAGAVAAITLLVSRFLRRRKAAAVPPPPPRPPWEIAIERLADLRRRKQEMLDAGQGAVFVEQLSNVVRAYLGGRYAFDGLETTTDEMLTQLQARGASLGFTHEVGQFLGRIDLVKFAKVEPDADEVDLLFAKAQDVVQMSEPEPTAPSSTAGSGSSAPGPGPVGSSASSPPARRSQQPNGGGPVV